MTLNDPFLAIAVMFMIPAVIVTVLAVILHRKDHVLLAALGHGLGIMFGTLAFLSAGFSWYIQHEDQVNSWIERLIQWLH
jgi:hypothetical protein